MDKLKKKSIDPAFWPCPCCKSSSRPQGQRWTWSCSVAGPSHPLEPPPALVGLETPQEALRKSWLVSQERNKKTWAESGSWHSVVRYLCWLVLLFDDWHLWCLWRLRKDVWLTCMLSWGNFKDEPTNGSGAIMFGCSGKQVSHFIIFFK